MSPMMLPKKSWLRNPSTSKLTRKLMILTLFFPELLKSENEHMPRLEDEFLEKTRSLPVRRRANPSETKILKQVLKIQKERQDQEAAVETDAATVDTETIGVINRKTTKEENTTMEKIPESLLEEDEETELQVKLFWREVN
jgi:hypothetical protein